MTKFAAKKSYNDFPSSSIDDGSLYFHQSSETDTSGGGSRTIEGPNYEVRLGTSQGLQLDTDKIYTVTSTGVTPPPAVDGTGTFTGTIAGLSEYFDGLKITYDLSTASVLASKMVFDLNSLGACGIYDQNGGVVSIEYLLSMGQTVLQYSSQIPNSTDPTSPYAGFQVVGFARDYVSTVGDNRYLKRTGGTMSGNINMGLNKITRLEDPTADTDAANKKYVDDLISTVTETVTDLVQELTSVSEPDTFFDAIDGECSANVAYVLMEKKEFFHDTLGLSTAMKPNTTIHVFVYCTIDEGNMYTYGSVEPTITIPAHFCGGVTSGSATQYDSTWVNGTPTYIGPAGNGGTAYQGNDYQITIPSRGFVEMSIFYNVYTVNNVQYSRTIIKCD